MGQITHYTQTHVFTSSSCGSRRHCSAVDENEVAWQCTVKHHTDIINFACMTWNSVRISASLSALCTNINQICHWHCISCKILPHFDVRTISVAQKMKKLCLYGPPNCFTVNCSFVPGKVHVGAQNVINTETGWIKM